jgi:NADPH-dependent curcumin reductase CurA
MADAQQIRLARVVEGLPDATDFELTDAPLAAPAAGEVLCRNEWLSLDPYMRSQMAGRHLSGAVGPGDVMRGETLSRVLESGDPRFRPGDPVRGPGGWQTHTILSADALARVDARIQPPTLALSTLGMPGLTAYAGIHWLGAVQPGETVLIPAATGAVGSAAGQLARLAGCRVIGMAGSDEKCADAVARLGYAACINRHEGDIAGRLDALCPEGIDVYLDLVGGPLLTIVAERLAIGGRVVLCGLMAEYNSLRRLRGPPPGLWIRARASVHGLVVYDFEPRRGEFLQACLPLVASGALQTREDISAGLDSAPAAFCRLMRGETHGKVLVKLH